MDMVTHLGSLVQHEEKLDVFVFDVSGFKGEMSVGFDEGLVGQDGHWREREEGEVRDRGETLRYDY